jgi:hypothetical protein
MSNDLKKRIFLIQGGGKGAAMSVRLLPSLGSATIIGFVPEAQPEISQPQSGWTDHKKRKS